MLQKSKTLINAVMIGTWGDYSNQGRELAYNTLCGLIEEIEAKKRPGRRLMMKLEIAYEDLVECVKDDARVMRQWSWAR